MKTMQGKTRGLLAAAPLTIALSFSCATPAMASPISVAYSSTSFGPIVFYADTFSELGASGVLALDTSALTTNVINSANLNVGDSGTVTDSEPITLNFDLTLDGVTHTLTQTGTWSISPSVDSVLAIAASGPVQFDTPSGSWQVSLNAFSLVAVSLGDHFADVSADFTPVPLPAGAWLFGSALGLLGYVKRRPRIA